MARLRPLTQLDPLHRLLGEAPAIQTLREHIHHLAHFDAIGNPVVPTVLLQGETGTGKGLVAQVIHDSGPRARGPFIEVNCAAIPEALLEAELFGFEAGAFTDAKRAKPGLFEAASGGTLLLDEIDALPLPLQGKLLTAIEAKRVRRVGAVVEHPMDVKLIAATQVDLDGQVAAGRFRADLYHRLAVVVLALPPLRARGEDILVLARALLLRYGETYGVGPQRLSKAAEAWLLGYHWPGNVRELSHLLERVVLLEPAAVIDPASLERLCLPQPVPAAPTVSMPTPRSDVPHETERITDALRQSGGNVAQAARLLGMSRGGLRYQMQRLRLGRSSGQAKSPATAVPPARLTPHPILSPARGEEKPLIPSSQWGEGTGEGAPQEPAVGWEPKPVAVLAIEATWPEMMEAGATRYEPWTVATRWEHSIAEKVAGFGGVVIQDSPSLLLVAFGLPRTLEQLPQRAVQAALAIRHLAAEVRDSVGEASVPVVRLAVHLGTLLVTGEAGATPGRFLAVGETLALPLRLLGHAAPRELLVSAAIGRLVEGWAELQVRALPSAAGPSEQSLAYGVVGLLPRRSSPGKIGTRSHRPFLGRARELAALQAVLAQVEGGRGQVVGIVGEPGMGKSRLLDEWRQPLAAHGVTYLEGHCWPYGSATPYLLVLDLLRAHCGITPADGADAITAKVRGGLRGVSMAPDEWAPYLLLLLGAAAGTERLAGMSPETLKAKTFEALRQMNLHSSHQHPLVIAVENLHWIDPTSEAWFASLVEGLAGARIVFLATYRPGYRPPWLDKSYATQLTLPPLSPQDSLQVVRAVLQTETLPESLAQGILSKAQGNPFFLEEIAQTLVDQGVLGSDVGAALRGRPQLGHPRGVPLPTDIQIPPTVQGVLAARIDRLPAEARALLQILAVIGKAFSLSLLKRVVEEPDAEVSQRLSYLQGVELIYEESAAPEPAYTFKHVLAQDVAYHSLPQERKQAWHERTAQAIEMLFGERLAERYSELAHHYSRSGNTQKAVAYLQRAGQQAANRSTYREAIMHLTRGLELLPNLPDSPERSRQELVLQIALGSPLMATKGQAASDVEHVYTRARELCQRVGETPQLFAVLQGLLTVYLVRGELGKARGLAEQLLSLAQRTQDPVRLARARDALGQTLFWLGELAPTRAHLEQAMALSDPTQDRSAALRYSSQILGVNTRRYAAWTLWLLGYPEQARQRSCEALALAQELSHPYSLAAALLYAARLHQFCREARAVHERTEALMALSTEQGFALRVAQGTLLRGWVRAAQGQWEEGIGQMCQGLTACRAMESGLSLPYYHTLLAEVYGNAGQTKEGLSLLAEARAAMHRSGERWWEAELYRLRGESLLVQNAERDGSRSAPTETSMVVEADGGGHSRAPLQTEAEACFQQALDVARRQQAKSLELRAVMSLSRLWQQQGQRDAARQLLAEVYGWFTEGFGTADLQEAKALLEALA